ncbi:universal stress protein [Citricoccus nitrophenolicus]|uniref:universal stress protein n=1 Tax=Citricoccus nitrophenolicus TaxID=863575 RepID=UPI0031EE8037
MTVLVAGTSTAEGKSAHRFAVEEAARRQEDVLYFVLAGERPEPEVASGAGVTEAYAEPDARGKDAVGDLLDTAGQVDVSAIVVGVRHRSPVGKLLLGSAAQQIILEASAPVICVKP